MKDQVKNAICFDHLTDDCHNHLTTLPFRERVGFEPTYCMCASSKDPSLLQKQ